MKRAVAKARTSLWVFADDEHAGGAEMKTVQAASLEDVRQLAQQVRVLNFHRLSIQGESSTQPEEAETSGASEPLPAGFSRAFVDWLRSRLQREPG